MIRQTTLNFLIIAFLVSSIPVEASAYDYFVAHRDPQIKDYLDKVENAHMNRSSSNPKGQLADFMEGKYGNAISDLKYVLERFPNHPKALMLIGMAAKLSKTPSVALEYFERATKLFPQYALTRAQYGEYLVGIGRIAEGISMLQRATEIDPKLAIAYDWLSKAYIKVGEQELARRAAEKAKELGHKTNK
jgi:predicted Zn-dependent protease